MKKIELTGQNGWFFTLHLKDNYTESFLDTICKKINAKIKSVENKKDNYFLLEQTDLFLDSIKLYNFTK